MWKGGSVMKACSWTRGRSAPCRLKRTIWCWWRLCSTVRWTSCCTLWPCTGTGLSSTMPILRKSTKLIWFCTWPYIGLQSQCCAKWSLMDVAPNHSNFLRILGIMFWIFVCCFVCTCQGRLDAFKGFRRWQWFVHHFSYGKIRHFIGRGYCIAWAF